MLLINAEYAELYFWNLSKSPVGLSGWNFKKKLYIIL